CFTSLFHCRAAHRGLPSFPTRRSSDLKRLLGPRGCAEPGAFLASQVLHRLCHTPGGSQMAQGPRPEHGPLTGVRVVELAGIGPRSEEHTSELQSRENLVCRLLLEKKKE